MYNVNSATANWDILTGKRAEGKNDASQNIFGASFKAMLESKTGGSGIQDMFDRLAERFSNADVSKGKPGTGSQGTKDYFGSEEGDKVAVDENLLAAMFGNNGLAQKVEDAIANFFNSDAGANAPEGSYTQRSVSITITAVRYNVSQFDSESGDLMSAQEMMSSMQEKMEELIGRLFGEDGAEAADAGEEEAAGESKKGGKGKGDKGNDAFNYQAFSFSMEMFFSNQMLNGKGGKNGQNSQFSMAGLAMGGSYQNYAGSGLSSSIYEALKKAGDFSGPFTSLIDPALDNFGMKSSGFQFSASGFSLKANSSSDLLSQLLDQLMNNSKRPEASDKPAELAEPEAPEITDTAAEELAEVAAV
jgi:hypothetical protein